MGAKALGARAVLAREELAERPRIGVAPESGSAASQDRQYLACVEVLVARQRRGAREDSGWTPSTPPSQSRKPSRSSATSAVRACSRRPSRSSSPT